MKTLSVDDAFDAGEQAGFERGVRAEREAWIAGNRGMDAGRAEREAEVAAHVRQMIAGLRRPVTAADVLESLLAWLEQPT